MTKVYNTALIIPLYGACDPTPKYPPRPDDINPAKLTDYIPDHSGRQTSMRSPQDNKAIFPNEFINFRTPLLF